VLPTKSEDKELLLVTEPFCYVEGRRETAWRQSNNKIFYDFVFGSFSGKY
jgi:hypothetical protein